MHPESNPGRIRGSSNGTLKTCELCWLKELEMKFRLQRLGLGLREFFAVSLWLFLFTKIFIYDVDLLLISRVHSLQSIYPYKFFLIMAGLATAWLILGGKYARKILLYIGLYPFIVLFWRVPKLLFKNWATLLLFAPAIESLISKFKWRFTLVSFAMLATLGISLFTSALPLTACMLLLGVYLLLHYIFRIRIAYKPESLFANIAPVMDILCRQSIDLYKTKAASDKNPLEIETPEFRKKRIQNLKDLYLNNLLWSYLATRLRVAVSSRRTDLYFILALIYTCILTVIVFGFEYWALYRITPSSFHSTGPIAAWEFFLFSFNAILHTEFATVTATSGAALILANLELGAGLVIGLFFVFVLLTSQRERYRQDLTLIVDQLSHGAREIEIFLDKELGMKLIEVEVKIIEVDPTFSSTLQSFNRTPPATVTQ